MRSTAATRAITREQLRAQRVAVLMLAFLASLVLLAPKVRANDLVVTYDQSQLLRLPRAVASIIIGNPSIADVTVQDSNLLVITGKTFGITNIIALDAEKNVIQDQRVVVKRDDARTVNLSKAGVRQSYSCTPNCSPTLTIGDDKDYFELIQGHAAAKTKFSDAAGQGGQMDGQ